MSRVLPSFCLPHLNLHLSAHFQLHFIHIDRLFPSSLSVLAALLLLQLPSFRLPRRQIDFRRQPRCAELQARRRCYCCCATSSSLVSSVRACPARCARNATGGSSCRCDPLRLCHALPSEATPSRATLLERSSRTSALTRACQTCQTTRLAEDTRMADADLGRAARSRRHRASSTCTASGLWHACDDRVDQAGDASDAVFTASAMTRAAKSGAMASA